MTKQSMFYVVGMNTKVRQSKRAITNLLYQRRFRFRFAPSPTGSLHIGGLMTVVANDLLIRRIKKQIAEGGQGPLDISNYPEFILRIEDTDRSRYKEGAVDDIVRGLEWLEVPPIRVYTQSDRAPIHRAIAKLMVRSGYAFNCYLTPNEIEMVDSGQTMELAATIKQLMDKCSDPSPMTVSEIEAVLRIGGPTRSWFDLYAGFHMGLPPEPFANREQYVVRLSVRDVLKITEGTPLTTELGHEELAEPSDMSCAVLIKGDGMPTYHLASVVDNELEKIGIVMRGKEWFPSLILHAKIIAAVQLSFYQTMNSNDALDAFNHDVSTQYESTKYSKNPSLLYPDLKSIDYSSILRLFFTDGQPIKFVHLPLLLSASGGKVSKRRVVEGEYALVKDLQISNPLAVYHWLAHLLFPEIPVHQRMSRDEMADYFDLYDLLKAKHKVPNFSLLSKLSREYDKVDLVTNTQSDILLKFRYMMCGSMGMFGILYPSLLTDTYGGTLKWAQPVVEYLNSRISGLPSDKQVNKYSLTGEGSDVVANWIKENVDINGYSVDFCLATYAEVYEHFLSTLGLTRIKELQNVINKYDSNLSATIVIYTYIKTINIQKENN